MRDPYAVLGLEAPATAEEVRAAYRARSMLLHPDLHAGRPVAVRREAERAMAQLTDAYEALTRPGSGGRPAPKAGAGDRRGDGPPTPTAPYRLGRLLGRSGIRNRPAGPEGKDSPAYRLGRMVGRRRPRSG